MTRDEGGPSSLLAELAAELPAWRGGRPEGRPQRTAASTSSTRATFASSRRRGARGTSSSSPSTPTPRPRPQGRGPPGRPGGRARGGGARPRGGRPRRPLRPSPRPSRSCGPSSRTSWSGRRLGRDAIVGGPGGRGGGGPGRAGGPRARTLDLRPRLTASASRERSALRLAQASPRPRRGRRGARALARSGEARLSGPVGAVRALLPLLVAEPPLLVVCRPERDVEETAQDLQTLRRGRRPRGQRLALPAPGPPALPRPPRHADASARRAAALLQARSALAPRGLAGRPPPPEPRPRLLETARGQPPAPATR